jgi:hypothetical protein
MWHCSVNQSNPKGFGYRIKFGQSPNMMEEFNPREAVRDAKTLYMTAQCKQI